MVGSTLSTGSQSIDSLLGGGFPFCSLIDIFGASGTGKTQIAFQSSLSAVLDAFRRPTEIDHGETRSQILVAYLDCGGSFRPERLIEIAFSRGYDTEVSIRALEKIFAVRVQDKRDQMGILDLFIENERYSSCRLIVVDDVSTNFLLGSNISDADVVERQLELSLYARKLALVSVTKRIPILITNSVRFREGEVSDESEALGDIFSMYSLFRIHLTKHGRHRIARLEQPYLGEKSRETLFEINSQGVP